MRSDKAADVEGAVIVDVGGQLHHPFPAIDLTKAVRTEDCLSAHCEKEPEYRVWVHPKEGGDDVCYRSESFVGAFRARKKLLSEPRWAYVEQIICAVSDFSFDHLDGCREVLIDSAFVQSRAQEAVAFKQHLKEACPKCTRRLMQWLSDRG